VADLDDPAESGQGFFVELFVGQKFRVIKEIPQEPAQPRLSVRTPIARDFRQCEVGAADVRCAA
jgi:hypothetical protein